MGEKQRNERKKLAQEKRDRDGALRKEKLERANYTQMVWQG